MNHSSFRSQKFIHRFFKVAPVLLIFVALALRIHDLGERSYFNDELSAIHRLDVSNFDQLINDGIKPDYHPGGIQVFLYLLQNITGKSELWFRLPFVLAGVTSVWLLFVLGKRWFGKSTAWLAASALAILQFPILYSQLARPYSTGLMFILMTTLAWDKLLFSENLKHQKKILFAAFLALSLALAMYNHYFSFFVAAMIGITGLLFIKRDNIVHYLSAGLIAVLLFLPHLNISIEQVKRGGLSTWLPPPQTDWLIEHVNYIFNNSWILTVSLIVIAIVIPLLCIKYYRTNVNINKTKLLIAAIWYIIPVLFAFIYSISVNPILQHSIMLFVLPFLLLILFAGFGNKTGTLTMTVNKILPLLLTIHLIFCANYYQKHHYADFKLISNKICRSIEKNPDILWGVQVNHPSYYEFYFNEKCKNNTPLFDLITDHSTIALLDQHLENNRTASDFIYARLRPADPLVTSIIRKHFPYLAEYINTGNYAEYYHFTKNRSTDVKHTYFDTINLLKADHSHQNFKINEEDEYYTIYSNKIDRNLIGETILLHCNIEKDTLPIPNQMHIVFTVINRKGDTKSWGGLNTGQWQHIRKNFLFTIQLPHNLRESDTLKVYIWNAGAEKIMIKKVDLMLIKQISTLVNN